MKRLLICPSERPAVPILSALAPLAAVPLLGQSLLEYWLSALSCAGARQVTVLAHERASQIRNIVGDGSRWGLQLELVEESRELSPAQALLKYPESPESLTQNNIDVLDHFPGLPEHPVFSSYGELFAALQQWMPRANTPDRVGMRETSPGVWVGSHSIISPRARLHAPCWIGRHVFLGPGVVIGPQSVVEDGAFLEGKTEVVGSCIGPDTFVGKFAQITEAFAWGNSLLNWRTNLVIQIPDPYLMCGLRQPRQFHATGWFARLADLYARNKEEAGELWKHLLLNKEG